MLGFTKFKSFRDSIPARLPKWPRKQKITFSSTATWNSIHIKTNFRPFLIRILYLALLILGPLGFLIVPLAIFRLREIAGRFGSIKIFTFGSFEIPFALLQSDPFGNTISKIFPGNPVETSRKYRVISRYLNLHFLRDGDS